MIIEKKTNYEIIEKTMCGKKSLCLYSYNSLVCEYVENPGMGFTYLYRFGRDWNYSKTTMKHLLHFIRNYTIYNFAGKQEIEKVIERGYVSGKEYIAVLYDETQY